MIAMTTSSEVLDQKHYHNFLSRANIDTPRDTEIFKDTSDRYGIPYRDILLMDFNRTGVHLPENQVRVGYRARFIVHLPAPVERDTYFALPVRNQGDTAYSIVDRTLIFANREFVATVDDIELDTCDVSYQRTPNLLNLNSRSRGNCAGCRACVHNYKELYDGSVLKDQNRLFSNKDIAEFFDHLEKTGVDITNLGQIAVVTGLFGGEEAVIKHLERIREVVKPRGFEGEYMYFGCEVNSPEALARMAALGNTSLIYAIDNFTKRDKVLAQKKARISLEDAHATLSLAKSMGIETTYAYVAGIDDHLSMRQGAELYGDVITRFPIINTYQIQTMGQAAIMAEGANGLEYYVISRRMFEDVYKDSGFRPRRWENYRPLWYDEFAGEPLED